MILPFLVRGVVGSLKPPVFPGSNSWGYGSYGVTIPEYNTLTVEIWGAGGGGSNAAQGSYQATDGGTSYFAAPSGTVYAFGGTHGYFDASGEEVLTIPGSHGSASGGDINTVGGGNPGGAGGSWNTFNGAPAATAVTSEGRGRSVKPVRLLSDRPIRSFALAAVRAASMSSIKR